MHSEEYFVSTVHALNRTLVFNSHIISGSNASSYVIVVKWVLSKSLWPFFPMPNSWTSKWYTTAAFPYHPRQPGDGIQFAKMATNAERSSVKSSLKDYKLTNLIRLRVGLFGLCIIVDFLDFKAHRQ